MASETSAIANHSRNSKDQLDAYQLAPKELKDLWKSWTKAKPPFHIPGPSSVEPAPGNITEDVLEGVFASFILDHLSVLFAGDLEGLERFADEVILASAFSLENVELSVGTNRRPYTRREFEDFAKLRLMEPLIKSFKSEKTNLAAYTPRNIPGLVVLPKLLPPVVQQTLLDQLLHSELSKPENQTNFHLHYNVSYPGHGDSFFSTKPEDFSFAPKDLNEHKPMLNRTALEKNLHWVTLGGQYDWTNKVYPDERPPKFSETIASLIGHIFTDMVPEAAIINVYSARDKLSMHRDVSEEADRGLVSVSLGCACIFIIGLEDRLNGQLHQETLRLESGDVVYMAGESRYAWHGVPKIIPDTTPEYLAYWPGKMYQDWNGWMSKKRINLNIRQMFEKADNIDVGFSKAVSSE